MGVPNRGRKGLRRFRCVFWGTSFGATANYLMGWYPKYMSSSLLAHILGRLSCLGFYRKSNFQGRKLWVQQGGDISSVRAGCSEGCRLSQIPFCVLIELTAMEPSELDLRVRYGAQRHTTPQMTPNDFPFAVRVTGCNWGKLRPFPWLGQSHQATKPLNRKRAKPPSHWTFPAINQANSCSCA